LDALNGQQKSTPGIIQKIRDYLFPQSPSFQQPQKEQPQQSQQQQQQQQQRQQQVEFSEVPLPRQQLSVQSTNSSQQIAQSSAFVAIPAPFIGGAASRSLDLLFLIDCTNSMHRVLSQLHDKIEDVISAIPDASFRLAFVGYRDHGYTEVAMLDFTDDVAAFKNKVRSTRAEGGGDVPEDIAGGLRLATTASWKASRRMLIHIGDTPNHGTKYGDYPDQYPSSRTPLGNGEPEKDVVKLVKDFGARYYFMRMDKLTDKMIGVFNDALAAVDATPITILPLSRNASEFFDNSVSAVKDTLF